MAVTLEMGATKPAVECRHFPTTWQAVLWRNWGMVPLERIAKALRTTRENLLRAGAMMGLSLDESQCDKWLTRGYLTIIRQNWHLLSYDQILTLLDWTAEKLDFILREDDFFWIKLGCLKPTVEEPFYKELTTEQIQATEELRCIRDEVWAKQPSAEEPPFGFLQSISAHGRKPANDAKELRMLYSYSALYGDPLIDAKLDPFPDNMLDVYAANGINALWMQAVLYSLVPWFGETPYSDGWQTRLENLRNLSKRMAARGIKLMLYLNEPRAMPAAFFENHPEWKGIHASFADLSTLCTSNPEVLKMLEDGVKRLFTEVPDLGGLFCITMSENLTNCWAKSSIAHPPACPRCAPRGPAAVIADVIGAFARGAWAAKPDAEIIAWSWAWASPWNKDLIGMLPKGVKLQCVSETLTPTNVGGYAGVVQDYSISKPGPGPTAKELWKTAREADVETVAKVQLNCTWELSAVPYIPVPGLVEEHLSNLRKEGVKNFMLSWTLGGYPGGNIRLLSKSKEELAKEDFGDAAAPLVLKAYEKFDESFRHFPFNSTATIYNAPQNYGPHALLYDKPTGYRATMIGYPYDDLTSWRGNFYPEDVFENEFKILSEGWKEGLEYLEQAAPKAIDKMNMDDLLSVAKASYCHFRSTYLQICFVRRRNAGDKAAMKAIVTEEMALAEELLAVMRADSRIGFEASNHYYYTRNSLMEKVFNCRRLLKEL